MVDPADPQRGRTILTGNRVAASPLLAKRPGQGAERVEPRTMIETRAAEMGRVR